MMLSVESFPFIMSQSVLVENMLESKYYIVFITEPEAFDGVGKVALISNYIFLL